MNIRKPVDYREMYMDLDAAVNSGRSQIEVYVLIGKAVSSRFEKGAAVAAAEYLQSTCPDINGFSPRNVRRMRDFFSLYSQNTVLLEQAMQVGWTQNVIIMEAELTMEERAWYIKQVVMHKWSKKLLAENIEHAIYNAERLDDLIGMCYTEKNSETQEKNYEKDSVCEPDRTKTESGGSYSRSVDSAGTYLRYEDGISTKECRLRPLRFSDRSRAGRSEGYLSHLWWRLLGENIPPGRVYRPPRGNCRVIV